MRGRSGHLQADRIVGKAQAEPSLGHRGALRGESVERCPVFLCGDFEKRLHIIGGVPAGTPISGDARDQDV
jgi:hypothetical protein